MSELLSQSERSLIYKEVNADTKDSIIWKICGHATNNISELVNEFELIEKLAIAGIRRPFKRGIYQNKEAFGYQHFEGVSLKEFIGKGAVSLETFFLISLKALEVLRQLHQSDIYHLRLNSHNVLYNPRNFNICLIDFSLAGSYDPIKIKNFESWGTELSYIAPEMTGRLNQTVDGRSDLYSLGIVMYEMLCGHLPFEQSDKANLIHNILVKNPKNLRQYRNDIPQALADLVDKLLAKNPKDRYQTTHGVEQDLRIISEKMKDPKWDGNMQLALEDSAEEFYLSNRLVGRHNELEKLENLLESINRKGNKVCLISGLPGTGKTALVNTFKKEIQRQGGLMLSGKFEHIGSNLPHQAMVQALREFAAYTLSRPDEELEHWKNIIKRAAGEIGNVLGELVPEFDWILPTHNHSLELTANQMESRINFLFQRIIEEVASPTQPLVLFFDDLQWADRASMKSLISVIGNSYADHFLFIGAYRKDDPESEESFAPYLHDILHERSDAEELELHNLSIKDIRQLVRDSIAVDSVAELSEIIHNKTLGNPFFVNQFLENLYHLNILQYSPAAKIWVWDNKQARALQISDNVIEYMTEKVKKLSSREQSLLARAAFIGNTFSPDILARITDDTEEDIKRRLDFFLSENLIERTHGSQFHFVHDRIQQTAYEMVDESLHYNLAIALKLIEHQSPGTIGLFDLARHFNLGKAYRKPEDRYFMIELNLQAGLEAKKTASFLLAFDFLKQGIEDVEEADWQTHYNTILSLHHEAAEVGMIAGERADAERWLQIALEKAVDFNDRIRAHEIKINHLTETHQFAETIAHLLNVFEEIGYGIKRHPGKFTILREFLQVQWLLRNKKIEDIPNLPPMQDEKAKAFLKLTVMATTSIFGHAPDILPVVFFRQVKLSLKFGNSIYSPQSYASYGFAISVFMKNITKGYQFGKMGLSLVEKLHAEVVKTKVMVIFYGFLAYWKDSLIGSLAPLKQAYITGRQTGDLLYASFALFFQSGIRLQAGDPLADIYNTMSEDCNTIKNLGQELVYHISETQRQYIRNLVQITENPLILKDEEFEKQTLSKLDEEGDKASKFDLYYYKIALAFIFNNYEEAYKNLEPASRFEEETTSRQIPYPSYILLSALTLCKQLEVSNNSREIKKLKAQIKKKLQLLKSFTKHAPQNFSNKYSLAKAMLHQANHKPDLASEEFYNSIREAQIAGFIHEEALAREHFSYLLINNGKQEFGETMLQKAFEYYQKWGSISKCLQLKERFPEIIISPISKEDKGIAAYQNIYDLNTIIQSNQALSSENSLNGLLRCMIEMMIHNASVSRVVIILKIQNQNLSVLAHGDNREIIVGTEGHADEDELYPSSILNVVSRSKTAFISDNLSEDRKYNFDPYIQAHAPVSVCCLPITTKDDFLGTIYFENNLAGSVFDAPRVEFLKTITAQLAISLDNVLLYSEMEQKVNDRTLELVEKNDELARQKLKSDNLLLNILPEEIAEELKNFGKTTARSYESITVMFADIRNFSKIADSLGPEELVSELDLCFKAFDDICAKYGLEKIKTIGDAYMAAGGIPESNKATARDVVQAALAMRDFTHELSQKRAQEGRSFFEVRIGIHTGPVVAGVVGNKKFQYDIWGNTVNLAARMEQNSEAGRINVSHATYELIADEFEAFHRGKITAKNMGEVDMYFIDSNPTTVNKS